MRLPGFLCCRQVRRIAGLKSRIPRLHNDHEHIKDALRAHQEMLQYWPSMGLSRGVCTQRYLSGLHSMWQEVDRWHSPWWPASRCGWQCIRLSRQLPPVVQHPHSPGDSAALSRHIDTQPRPAWRTAWPLLVVLHRQLLSTWSGAHPVVVPVSTTQPLSSHPTLLTQSCSSAGQSADQLLYGVL